MNTRQEKIEYLKGLSDGSRSIDEITPIQIWVLRSFADNRNLYRDEDTGKEYSQQDLDKITKSSKGKLLIICSPPKNDLEYFLNFKQNIESLRKVKGNDLSVLTDTELETWSMVIRKRLKDPESDITKLDGWEVN